MKFILAILASAVAVAGMFLLINNISASASAVTSLIACLMFMGGSVLAADSWVKALKITITPNITGAVN